MDWSKLPDLVGVGLLAGGFVSVAKRSHTPVSANWLIAWLLIVLHFLASLFANLPGFSGELASFLSVLALVWAGALFMRACVPYREERSSIAMLTVLMGGYLLYLAALMFNGPGWTLNATAVLIGLGPLAVSLTDLPHFRHPLRVSAVAVHLALAAFLLIFQHRSDGADLALNGLLFAVYLATSLHFLMMFRRASAGALITTIGFFLWAAVFPIGESIMLYFPHLQVQGEVWNLPKYVVAAGMILSLLEDQIAHNKHLALHDELTGLPNRRLFLDRLSSALERARRTSTQAALLTIDLDHFKLVNDTLGHHAGDVLLQNVAKLFTGRIRRSDTVARTGGDEFAVILEAPTSSVEALLVGRELLDLLNAPMALKDRSVRVGASIGCAIFPADAEDMEALCIKADLRMYEDKRKRNSNKPEELGPVEHTAYRKRDQRGAGVIS
ncbi:MAG: diguanylate cyclase domain-containing protein [Acidobacteriota bacterium]